METERTAQRRQQDEELGRAKERAAAGDPAGTVEALHRSFFLDGLKKRLQRRWERLSAQDVEAAVADAVQAVYFSIKEGKGVVDVPAYLWKAADNIANDRYHEQQRERATTPEGLELHGGSSPSAEDEHLHGRTRLEEPDWEKARQQAIATARTLLPKIGHQNAQDVMEYLIGAAEADRLDVPNPEIAEALGLSVEVVRQSKSRGFRRLERAAQEEGVVLPTFRVVEYVPDDE